MTGYGSAKNIPGAGASSGFNEKCLGNGSGKMGNGMKETSGAGKTYSDSKKK